MSTEPAPRRAKADAGAQPPVADPPRRDRPLWVSLAINVALALLLVSLVQAFVVRVHNVSSGSMQNTLGVQDRVLSSRLPYLSSGPARGDIIIFGHGDQGWDSRRRDPAPDPLRAALRVVGDVTGIGTSNTLYTVKRVIGVGGDTVECCDVNGAVTVNGRALQEPYVYQDLPFRPGSYDCTTSNRSTRCFGPLRVPDGQLLIMGDHRSNSADSVVDCRGERDAAGCARFIDEAWVSGKVIAKAFPPGPVG